MQGKRDSPHKVPIAHGEGHSFGNFRGLGGGLKMAAAFLRTDWAGTPIMMIA